MFGARYYGSSLGRFMTPDWAAKPATVPYANFGSPQSLNLYAIVSDDPESFVDVDGHALEGLWTQPRRVMPEDVYSPTEGAIGESFNSAFSPDSGFALINGQFAQVVGGLVAQSQSQGGQISLSLGGTNVSGSYSFGSNGEGPSGPAMGATIDATATCKDCTWVQTVTSSVHGPMVDGGITTHIDDRLNSPLYYAPDKNHFYDSPTYVGQGPFGASFVTIVGTVNTKNLTFHAMGAMSWGYTVTAEGTVRGTAPHVANSGQLRSSLIVVRSKFPAWTIN